MSEPVQIILVVLTAYLLGSFPTAYVIGRLHKVNIFEVGSGNMGSTNAIRAMGCGWGIVVALIDITKGLAAVFLARQIMSDNVTAATVIAGSVAVIGHNWSFFVTILTGTLRGGKGAATALGTVLLIAPLHIVAAVCLIGALLVALTRYVSLAVLTMTGVGVLWMMVLVSQHEIAWEYGVYTLVLAALVLVRFRGNIQRLLAGTERRLGDNA